MHTATLAVWVVDAPCFVMEEACRLSVALQVHSEERRGLDRRIKDLEIRLSGALSSKSLSDEEHAQRAQVCPAAQLPPMPAGWSAGPKFIMRADKAAQLWRGAGTIAAVPASAVRVWGADVAGSLHAGAAAAGRQRQQGAACRRGRPGAGEEQGSRHSEKGAGSAATIDGGHRCHVSHPVHGQGREAQTLLHTWIHTISHCWDDENSSHTFVKLRWT